MKLLSQPLRTFLEPFDQKCVAYRVVSTSLCAPFRLTSDIWRNIVSYVLEDWDWFKAWSDDGEYDNYTSTTKGLKCLNHGSKNLKHCG